LTHNAVEDALQMTAARGFAIPNGQLVRVVQQGYMGSGYGYRSGIDLSEVHAAILSKLTGRPIKNNYTRYEDFVTRTHRPQFQDEMKMGGMTRQSRREETGTGKRQIVDEARKRTTGCKHSETANKQRTRGTTRRQCITTLKKRVKG